MRGQHDHDPVLPSHEFKSSARNTEAHAWVGLAQLQASWPLSAPPAPGGSSLPWPPGGQTGKHFRSMLQMRKLRHKKKQVAGSARGQDEIWAFWVPVQVPFIGPE